MRNNIVDNYQEEQNQNTYQNLLQSQILGESPTNENEKLDKWTNNSLSGKKKKNKVFKFNSKYKKKNTIKRAATWPINLLNMKKSEY